MIGLLGLDHQYASIEHRGRLTLTGDALAGALRRLAAAPEIDEVVILSTCNRTEVYIAAEDWAAARGLLLSYLSRLYHAAEEHAPQDLVRVSSGERDVSPQLPEIVEHALYALEDQQVARHLFRVASGLESMVVGEAQILGQVRDALAAAEQEETLDDELRTLFTTALKIGKRVRTETEIGRADVSLAGLAVRVASEELGGLPGKRALVIGAGRTSQLCAELLHAEGVSHLLVTNRTSSAAEAVAAQVGGEALAFDRLADGLAQADIVMSATASPAPVLGAETLRAALAARVSPRPIIILDLAVPPDIEPAAGALPGVRLFTLDELRSRETSETTATPHLASEVARAEALISESMQDFQRERTIRRMGPGIATLRRHVESSQQSELSRALTQLGDLTPEQQQVVTRFGQRLVDKMFHHLVSRIRSLAEYDEVPPEVTLRVLEQLLAEPGARPDMPQDAEHTSAHTSEHTSQPMSPSHPTHHSAQHTHTRKG